MLVCHSHGRSGSTSVLNILCGQCRVVEHENKLELLERGSDRHLRPPTPVPETTPRIPISQLLVRSEDRVTEPWTIRVVLVPSRWQQFAFEYESTPYKRCQSRNLHQHISLSDNSSHVFTRTVEIGFGFIMRGRPWMPLLCFRSSDKSLGQLPPDKRNSDTWDYVFLEEHCLASDKAQRDVLYIALQHEDLNWHEIRGLPAAMDSDELCWAYDEALDGPVTWPLPATAPVEAITLDSDAMHLDPKAKYSYSPPPYSSRVSARMDHPPTPLDVLATSASLLPPTSLHPQQQDPRPLTRDTAQSQHSVEAEASGDEHRVKKPKLRAMKPDPRTYPTGAGETFQQQQTQTQTQNQVFYSGRTKRKLTVSGKSKDPVRWNVGDLRNPVFGLLHRHDGKDKSEAAS